MFNLTIETKNSRNRTISQKTFKIGNHKAIKLDWTDEPVLKVDTDYPGIDGAIRDIKTGLVFFD